MLTLFLILSIAAMIFGVYIADRSSKTEFAGVVIAGLGFCVFIFVSCYAVDAVGNVARGKIIDERISIYEEENSQIEARVEAAVLQYIDYESSTFANLKPDELVFAASAYPELKADELVQSEITLYIYNNSQIRQLKEEKLQAELAKWLLWFGGDVNQKE